MKYTRYEIKKRKNNNLGFVKFMFFIIAVICAFFIGRVLSEKINYNKAAFTVSEIDGSLNSNTQNKIKEDSVKKNIVSKSVVIIDEKKEGLKNTEIKKNDKVANFLLLYCGEYSNDEYSEEQVKFLKGLGGNPFIIKDKGLTKIYFGIFGEENVEKYINVLKTNNVDVSRIILRLNIEDKCDLEVAELITANLKILSALLEKDVSAVSTKELKNYCLNLKESTEQNKNYKCLSDLKEIVKNMGDKLTDTQASEVYKLIYLNLESMSK